MIPVPRFSGPQAREAGVNLESRALCVFFYTLSYLTLIFIIICGLS